MNVVKRLLPILMTLPAAAYAAPPVTAPPENPPPTLHAGNGPGDQGPNLGPNVVIKPRPGEPMIEEYKVNDRTFMIKVTPVKGFSYYLVDMDGDGRFETRRNVLQPDLLVPQWTLLRWK